MMPRCRHCRKKAVIKKHWFWYCEEHFFAYYKKRIKRVLNKVRLNWKKILVATSWGKDSQALLDVLVDLKSQYWYELEAVFIKLAETRWDNQVKNQFVEFVSKALEAVENLTGKLWVKLNILNLQNIAGKSLPDIVFENGGKACSICGTLKRYFLNKFAFENWFDYIATGHNLTDNVIFIKQNIIATKYEDIYKNILYVLPGDRDLKLVSKIRPQFWIEEEDNVWYCKLKDIKYVSSDNACPLKDVLARKSQWNTHLIVQEFVEKLSEKFDYARKFMEFLRKNLKEDGYDLAKIKKSELMKECKICGYPTASHSGICRVCRLLFNN